MDVYLVPASRDRYELYCEVGTSTPGPDEPAKGLWGRAVRTFRRALAEGEQYRTGRADRRDVGRVRHTITRKLAEAVAEQRLLWHLRRESAATLLYPDDVDAATAEAACRKLLLLDRDKHRRWCIIDALLAAASAPIALIPGPNFLAYYFIFRSVGHYFSMIGAAHGLGLVQWTPVGSPLLTELRAALPMAPDVRSKRVAEISQALGLDDLERFVEHVADRAVQARHPA
jgi:hypothetical protein